MLRFYFRFSYPLSNNVFSFSKHTAHLRFYLYLNASDCVMSKKTCNIASLASFDRATVTGSRYCIILYSIIR